jgi:hypothetical protein
MRRFGEPRQVKGNSRPIVELTLDQWLDRWYPDCSQTARDQLEEVINK